MSHNNIFLKSGLFLFVFCLLLNSGTARNLTSRSDTEDSVVEVTYLGNEGVLVVTSNHKILIDALFDKPNPEYTSPPSEMLEAMKAGRPPFDNVNLVLVTHNHLDHFSAAPAARFMENNPGALLMAAGDTAAVLKENITEGEDVEDRILSFDLEPGDTAEKTVNEISIKIFRTLHSGDRESPHNLMFLIKMDGRTIFHEGDSDGKPATFEKFGLAEEKIDLALVHFWFPLHPDAAKIIQEILKPEHVGLIHLPKRLESDTPGKIEMVKSYYKDIFLFVKPGEKKSFRF